MPERLGDVQDHKEDHHLHQKCKHTLRTSLSLLAVANTWLKVCHVGSKECWN